MDEINAADLVKQNNRMNTVKNELPALQPNARNNVNENNNNGNATTNGSVVVQDDDANGPNPPESNVTVIPVDHREDHFVVTWKNLTYTVGSNKGVKGMRKRMISDSSTAPPTGKKKTQKTIFNSLTGQFKSGEMTALIGPSGSGKSSLLECIAGIRRQGRFGEVSFSGFSKVKVAFIPQSDHFLHLLTVRECLEFSSHFRDAKHVTPRGKAKANAATNRRRGSRVGWRISKDQEASNPAALKTSDIVDHVIEELNLQSCQNTYVSRCSGGQLKRLSVAQELIARPQILLLDEPTSGLDSLSCLQTIELLYHLTQVNYPPLAILLTIHQPPAKVFNLFHSVYALSSIGRCIYEGPPGGILDYLKKFGLDVPPFSNVADYLVETSSGQEGIPIMKEMALEHERATRELMFTQSLMAHHAPNRSIFASEYDLEDMVLDQKHPLFQHIWLHFKRSILAVMRDPQLGILRILITMFAAICIGLLYSDPNIGSSAGCPPSLTEVNEPEKFSNLAAKIEVEKTSILNNLGLWFFTIMFLQFGAMLPTVLSFSLEVNVIAKERTNGWYGALSYYIGKTLADIPFQIICPLIWLAIVFPLTNQPMEVARFIDVSIVFILISVVSQSHGTLVGSIFMSDLQVALFVAPITAIPLVIFSGFLIRVYAIPYYLKVGTYISYVRYGMEAVIIAVYGMDRCGQDSPKRVEIITQRLTLFLKHLIKNGLFDEDAENTAEETERVNNITNSMVTGIVRQFSGRVETVSGSEVTGVLAEFKLSEDDFIRNIIILFGFYVILRVITFFVILRKGINNK